VAGVGGTGVVTVGALITMAAHLEGKGASVLDFMGFAQKGGAVTVARAHRGEVALLRAIEMNGVAIESNKTSFLWGRRAAVDLARVERIAVPAQPVVIRMPETLDKLIKRRVAFLADYQDAAYAESFARFVEQVRAKEATLNLGDKLTMAVARNLSKLMAYKDEYEVARLYTDGRFVEQLKQQFEGDFSLSFNLAPPLFSKKDAQGRLVKAKYGSWMMSAFKVLAKFKGLRGGSLDVFGYTEERKTERRLIAEYRDTVTALLDGLNADKLALAVEIAQLPEQIRGYGHVKDKALVQARSKQDELLTRYAAAVPAGLAQKVNVASIAAA
jgi:indolepyruvate ferredoxin oxidoreductase